jgi:enoyl-CoA hydratase/carnithine racemase
MPPLLYEKKGAIAYITFNRPEARNALDPETIVRLADAWADFAEDQDLRVAIVTGAGDVAFSAGADSSPSSLAPASPRTSGTGRSWATRRSCSGRCSASSRCTSRSWRR